ncbi:thioredoxin family protein [Zobellia alginiliquefaciens]|uniref:thioredoxin family protein n=1 Tax=Zobellia alginiliquefaciens TaxID=3032586 RepID=UPI0023E40E61|nr:thioredoxin family protein [Zobellia alginiliquefaciens]
MAFVLSSMMELGKKAPEFKLPDVVSGELLSLEQLKSDKATVIIFICNHCLFVKHINSKLVEIANKYQALGMQFIAISSNDVKQHPEDTPFIMSQVAKYHKYPFPYLYDEFQDVALDYGAESNPDLFVFDHNLECVYTGRFDMTRPNIQPATGADLILALDRLLEGKSVCSNQYPSMGTSIAWRRGVHRNDNDMFY